MIATGENLTKTISDALNAHLTLADTIAFIDMGTAAQPVRPHYLLDEEPALQDIETLFAPNVMAAHVFMIVGIDAEADLFLDSAGKVHAGTAVLQSYGRTALDAISAFRRLIATINRNDESPEHTIDPNPASWFLIDGIKFYKFYPASFPNSAQTAKGRTSAQSPIYVVGGIIVFEIEVQAFA